MFMPKGELIQCLETDLDLSEWKLSFERLFWYLADTFEQIFILQMPVKQIFILNFFFLNVYNKILKDRDVISLFSYWLPVNQWLLLWFLKRLPIMCVLCQCMIWKIIFVSIRQEFFILHNLWYISTFINSNFSYFIYKGEPEGTISFGVFGKHNDSEPPINLPAGRATGIYFFFRGLVNAFFVPFPHFSNSPD